MKQLSLSEAHEVVCKLISDFEANKHHYLSPAYQEMEMRGDFLNKFFFALGWDVNHEEQKNPFRQEVKVESSVQAEGQRKADYAFFVEPNFKDARFYAEAKKPSVELNHADPYFQVIRYGWSAGTPIAILSSFAEFHVVDCRYKPDIDTATDRKIFSVGYIELLDVDIFSRLYFLFSRAAVLDGSLESFAETLPNKRGKAVQRGLFKGGYQSIDDAFLEEIDGHRETLARMFKRSNLTLDGDTLTEITQRTLDRLVFIRFLEDKAIHPENLISAFGDKSTVWRDFIAASRKLDAIYNGIVFKKHAVLDSEKFQVEDSVFADVCEELAHINSPYDFNSIPIHILGSIYERFLSKVIVTTTKEARVVERPEIRNQGGVFYTPEHIVRHIVEETIGSQIAGKSPGQIMDMAFVDISCGSGSFLICVFDYLLTYCRDWYNANPAQAEKAGCVRKDDGAWYLSLHQRRSLLLNCIHGVDIDHQAVEVAQLSLYLKLLEEETTASARHHQLEFHETLLPSLGQNIVCGNSLVGTDILGGSLFEEEAERRLNPMDFETRFPGQKRRGGFDAVVGNPPYRLLQPENTDNIELEYYHRKFTVAQYKMDLFHLFIERGINLLKDGGRLGYITPASFLTNNYTTHLRKKILEDSKIISILMLPDGAFKEASVDNVVFALEKDNSAAIRGSFPFHLAETLRTSYRIYETIAARQRDFARADGMMFRPARIPEFTSLAKLMARNSVKLGDIARVNFGMQLRDRKKYPKDVMVNPAPDAISAKHRPCLGGSDVQPYYTGYSNLYCLWDRAAQCGGCWDEEIQFAKRKILVRQIGRTPIATMDNAGLCCLNALFMIKATDPDYDDGYILGLINSQLLQAYWENRYFDFKKTFPKIKGTYLEEFPIKKASKKMQSRISLLVDQVLNARIKEHNSAGDADRDYYSNKAKGLGQQIDAIVYELYGIPEKTIRAIVESMRAPD